MYNSNIHHRRSLRLKGYDYSQEGLYFITICSHNFTCLFGNIVGANSIRPNEMQNSIRPNETQNSIRSNNKSQNHIFAIMKLNEYGKIAYDEWIRTPELRPNIKLHVFIIMPNHFHAIIQITRTGELNSPYISNELNSPYISTELNSSQTCPELNSPRISNELNSLDNSNELHSPQIPIELNSPYILNESLSHLNNSDVCNTSLRGPLQTIGAIVRGYKSAVTKQLRFSGFDGIVWQRNYYEHIIQNENAYHTISNYICNNPNKWFADKYYKNSK